MSGNPKPYANVGTNPPPLPTPEETIGPLRTESMEASANAAAQGVTYTPSSPPPRPPTAQLVQPQSMEKGKKAVRNILIQKPGAYAVVNDNNAVEEPPSPESIQPSPVRNNNDTPVKKGSKNSKMTRPGAYNVSTPVTGGNQDSAKKGKNMGGYGPLTPPRSAVTTPAATPSTTVGDEIVEPAFPGSESPPPPKKLFNIQGENQKEENKDAKNKKKVKRELKGPYTVLGPGGSAYTGYSLSAQIEELQPTTTNTDNQKTKGPFVAAIPDGRSPPYYDDQSTTIIPPSEDFGDTSNMNNQGPRAAPLSSLERVHGGEVLPEDSNIDVHAKWNVGILNTRKKRFFVTIGLLCVVGIVVGVALGLSSSSDGGESTPVSTLAPATTTTTSPTININPCVAMNASYTPSSDKFSTLSTFLIQNGISDAATLNDVPYSPQRRALCWVAEIDDQQFLNEEQDMLWRATQRYILSTMYYQLGNNGGGKFAKESNWVDRSTSECDWKGVTCNGEHKITKIELVDQDLKGSLLKEIAGLVDLNVLDLSFNGEITGVVPEEFSNLGSLTTINLKGDKLNGTLPTILGQLTNLEKINLESNEFHGTIPTEYGNLIHLDTFDVDKNINLEGNPGQIFKKWTKLEFLHLDKNKFNGTLLDDLISLPSLRDITVEFNDISGTLPSELGEISTLGRIRVSSNDMFGTLPTEYGQLSILEALAVSDNEFNSTLPTEYGGMTNLRFLYIDRNEITGDVLSDHPVCAIRKLEIFLASESDDFQCACCRHP